MAPRRRPGYAPSLEDRSGLVEEAPNDQVDVHLDLQPCLALRQTLLKDGQVLRPGLLDLGLEQIEGLSLLAKACEQHCGLEELAHSRSNLRTRTLCL